MPYSCAALLTGCADMMPATETVYLAKTGSPGVQCGPYRPTMGDNDMSRPERALRACVADYQAQGYQRIAAPSK
jgi:hypothetical protein